MLGHRLKQVRERRGLSQRELGRQAAVRYALISEIEAGKKHTIMSDALLRLARTLGVSTDFLLGTFEGTDEDDEPALLTLVR